MEGKGNISFLMPMETTEPTTANKKNKINRKWQQKMQTISKQKKNVE